MRIRSRFKSFARLFGLGLLAAISASASATPGPQATPRADPAEKLVSDLTGWLKLDSAQQAKARVFARDMIARNEQIMERWKKTNKTHPEELNASRGQFQMDLISILTPEQKKVYSDTSSRVAAKGHTVPTRPSVPTRPPAPTKPPS